MDDSPAIEIRVDRVPKKTDWKAAGGSDRDQWNDRQVGLIARALPFNPKNTEAISQAGSAVMAGIVDMKPGDPVEGILIAQLVVANEAALDLYRRAWACDPNRHFEAHTKYLQLADKASRTAALLTERLDQRRGRGQQQITVKHVTVNADQAVVTDQIVSGNAKDAASLTVGPDKPMTVLEPTQTDAVPAAAGTK
jgi:hypothetical protein